MSNLPICDICHMPIKPKVEKNNKTYLEKEKEEYFEHAFSSFWSVKPSPKKKPNLKYVINVNDVCEVCYSSFLKVCKDWEKWRIAQVRKLMFQDRV